MSVQYHDDAGSSLNQFGLTDVEIFDLFAPKVLHCSRTTFIMADSKPVAGASCPAAGTGSKEYYGTYYFDDCPVALSLDWYKLSSTVEILLVLSHSVQNKAPAEAYPT